MEYDIKMMETERMMLLFIKYGMIITVSVLATSYVIGNGWIDAITLSNHALIMMFTLIAVLFLMVMAIIIQIAIDEIIKWRKKKNEVFSD